MNKVVGGIGRRWRWRGGVSDGGNFHGQSWGRWLKINQFSKGKSLKLLLCESGELVDAHLVGGVGIPIMSTDGGLVGEEDVLPIIVVFKAEPPSVDDHVGFIVVDDGAVVALMAGL